MKLFDIIGVASLLIVLMWYLAAKQKHFFKLILCIWTFGSAFSIFLKLLLPSFLIWSDSIRKFLGNISAGIGISLIPIEKGTYSIAVNEQLANNIFSLLLAMASSGAFLGLFVFGIIIFIFSFVYFPIDMKKKYLRYLIIVALISSLWIGTALLPKISLNMNALSKGVILEVAAASFILSMAGWEGKIKSMGIILFICGCLFLTELFDFPF